MWAIDTAPIPFATSSAMTMTPSQGPVVRSQHGPRGQMVRTHTHFTRREPAEVPGVRRDAARVAGWGNRWWADPAYPWPTFHRRPGIATPKPPAQATVNRLPRGQRAPQPWSAWR